MPTHYAWSEDPSLLRYYAVPSGKHFRKILIYIRRRGLAGYKTKMVQNLETLANTVFTSRHGVTSHEYLKHKVT
jgi:hypothetical protein